MITWALDPGNQLEPLHLLQHDLRQVGHLQGGRRRLSTTIEFNVCPDYLRNGLPDRQRFVEDLHCDAGNIAGNYCDLATAVPRNRYLLLTLVGPRDRGHVTALLPWWNRIQLPERSTEDWSAMPVGHGSHPLRPGLFETGFGTGAASGTAPGPEARASDLRRCQHRSSS
jgi:hypothetical protein